MKLSIWRETMLPLFSLFTSAGTLLCCALPALLVTLGMGAALAGFVGAFPWISVISEYKVIVFISAGVMLSLATVMQWTARHRPCPIDPKQARLCTRLRQISWGILLFSIAVYAIGVFFAFFAADLFYS